ncbi:MAG TPA: arginine deiminase family protein [Gaiellaceae bacterium]|nr:arginine deiminase family protein [Gaiellaceae bacterium]
MRILVRAPHPDATSSWRSLGWRSAPDSRELAREHELLCAQLEDAGAEVIRAQGDPDNLDSIYAFDPALLTRDGVLLLRPGKPARRHEPETFERTLDGVPVVGRLAEPELAEGGDMFWLDERTLIVGRSYRTNDAGIDALRTALPGVDVLAFDLPHVNGRNEVLHLLSLISPLAADLAVVYLPLMPARLVELLEARGVELVEVPDEEFETMGPNVLALAPRVGIAVEGNPETRRRLEKAGVEMLVYRGRELSKGDGGPTCLTFPLGAVDSPPGRSS